MTEARQMSLDALTYDDCRRLLEAEYPKYVIADRYSMSMVEFHEKLRDFGLKKNGKSWDYSTAKDKTEQTRLTPGDLTREQAARMLLAGVGKTVIRRKYNYPNDPACYLQLEKWGLHRKGLPTEFQAKQEEIKRMAAAVLEEIGRGEKSAIQWHEDKVKSDVIYGYEQTPEQAVGLGNVTIATAVERPDEALPAYEDCVTCGKMMRDSKGLMGCNLPTQKDIQDCIEQDYVGWIPETPISEAVTQAIEAGEVKVETVERPAPALSEKRELKEALAPADLDSMTWFTPHLNPNKDLIRQITICVDGSIRLSTGLLKQGPVPHRVPGCSFSARIGIQKDMVVIKPDEKGFTFSGTKTGICKKASAKSMIDWLKKKMTLPATYQAEWNERERAWVGRLVEKEAGVA